MKTCYREKKFSGASRDLLDAAVKVIEAYQEQNITMTLRQLYYQLVVANVIPNKVAAYSQIASLITDARYAGLVDWDAIEDNLRKPRLPSLFSGVPELLDAALYSYHLDWWEDMDNYVELYTEKDALSSILAPIARENRIIFQVNRGYASASSMYAAAQRFLEKDKERVILYLGDHDPSGLDMVRDIRARLEEFGVTITVKPLALTWAQIEEYNPPPNPAKLSDSRSAGYIEKFGNESWEVDALPPEEMIRLVEDGIRAYVDSRVKKQVLVREKKDIESVRLFRNSYR